MAGPVTDRALEAPDDEALVARARAGDVEAQGRLVERHQGVVYRFLVGLTRDEDAAADVAQDTFVRALTHLDAFRGDAAFRTWLIAIARNEARGWNRRTTRRRESPLDEVPPRGDGQPTPEMMAVRSTEVERVRKALARLPEKQRLSVALRIFDGLSFREVARATDSTEGAARVNYHHGIRRLREWLNE